MTAHSWALLFNLVSSLECWLVQLWPGFCPTPGAERIAFLFATLSWWVSFEGELRKYTELKCKLNFSQCIVLCFSGCYRIQFSVCSFHPSVCCSSVHGWFWADGSYAIPLHLPLGVGWTENKNSCWQYELFLLQWFSDVVCPDRLFWTWLEKSANDCYSASSVAVSFLEVSKWNAEFKSL